MLQTRYRDERSHDAPKKAAIHSMPRTEIQTKEGCWQMHLAQLNQACARCASPFFYSLFTSAVYEYEYHIMCLASLT